MHALCTHSSAQFATAPDWWHFELGPTRDRLAVRDDIHNRVEHEPAKRSPCDRNADRRLRSLDSGVHVCKRTPPGAGPPALSDERGLNVRSYLWQLALVFVIGLIYPPAAAAIACAAMTVAFVVWFLAWLSR